MSSAIRDILKDIEYGSRAGRQVAKIPDEYARWANAAAIEGFCFIESGGYRLTPAGRRHLWELPSNQLACLRSLKTKTWTNVGKPHWNGIVWRLARNYLIRYQELPDDTVDAKLTFLSRAVLNPPELPTPTHVIKLAFEGYPNRSQRNIKISATDAEAVQHMHAILHATNTDNYSDPSLTVRRIDTNAKIGQISREQAMKSPFAPEIGWDILGGN